MLGADGLLPAFHTGLAADAVLSHRSCHQSSKTDLPPALFADTECAVFDILQRVSDLPDQVTFPVPDPQLGVSFIFKRCSVDIVSKKFCITGNSRTGEGAGLCSSAS